MNSNTYRAFVPEFPTTVPDPSKWKVIGEVQTYDFMTATYEIQCVLVDLLWVIPKVLIEESTCSKLVGKTFYAQC